MGTRSTVLAGCSIALALFGATARIYADPYQLHFQADATCKVSIEAFRDAVHAQTVSSPFSVAGRVPVVVQLWSTEDGAMGELMIGTHQRRIAGADCEQVLNTLALIVAVSLDQAPSSSENAANLSPPADPNSADASLTAPTEEIGRPTSDVQPTSMPSAPGRRGWPAMAREVDRPLTMPEGVLRLEFHNLHSDLPPFGGDEIRSAGDIAGQNAVSFTLAAGYGVTDNIEIGIDGTRSGVAPSSGIGVYWAGSSVGPDSIPPTLYGRLRYLELDSVELGVDLSLEASENFAASLGLVHLRVREGPTALDFRLDVAAARDAQGKEFDGIVQSFLRLRANLGDHVYAGAQIEGKVIGYGFRSTAVHAGVGFTVGTTIDLETLLLDLSASGHLPAIMGTELQRSVFETYVVDFGVAAYLPAAIL